MGVDGVCRLVGRGDDQMKVNGQRIEAGEVRHALLTSSLVTSELGGGGGEGGLVRDAEVASVRVEGKGGGLGRDVLVAFVRVEGKGMEGGRTVVVEGGEVKVGDKVRGKEEEGIVWVKCVEVEEKIRKEMRFF